MTNFVPIPGTQSQNINDQNQQFGNIGNDLNKQYNVFGEQA
jgi:hypothetical protein